MTIDFAATLRKRKPEKPLGPLRPRARHEIPELTSLRGGPPAAMLLDTNVYIDRAAGRLAKPVRDAIDQAMLFHCSVALGELAVGVAHADPRRAGWRAMRDHYMALLDAVPESRLVTPDAQVWADAGVVAGTVARLQGLQAHQRKACLNDALIFLTAANAGLPVLTGNRDEFDFMQQIVPEGRFLYYVGGG